jgi:hypothetical protein
MAGQIINVIPPRLFDFSNLSTGYTDELVICRALDVSQWADASLLVRVNDVSALVGGNIVINAYYVAPTDDDPGIDFISTAFSGGQIFLDSTIPSPSLQGAPVYSPLGSALMITVQGGRTALGTITAVFSIDVKVTNFFAV